MRHFKRTSYKGYIIDHDNLGRPYIYNTASRYSEDSDHVLVYASSLRECKAIINARIATGQDSVTSPVVRAWDLADEFFPDRRRIHTTQFVHRYDFAGLKDKALAPEATQEDLAALAQWFSNYDPYDWNGECYDIDGAHGLYPIYDTTDGDCEIVGYEIR